MLLKSVHVLGGQPTPTHGLRHCSSGSLGELDLTNPGVLGIPVTTQRDISDRQFTGRGSTKLQDAPRKGTIGIQGKPQFVMQMTLLQKAV